MNRNQIEVITWNELNSMEQVTQALGHLREIFFLTSSRQSFASDQDREDFFERWAGQYLKESPEQVYLARVRDLSKTSIWQAYALTSQRAELSSQAFAPLFADYPTHLHINCHPQAQGQGLGRALIEHIISDLRQRRIGGLHAVTSLDAENLGFYQRLGFTQIQKHSSLVFMALKLIP